MSPSPCGSRRRGRFDLSDYGIGRELYWQRERTHRMAWIESHQSLGRHPKVFRFASKLRIHKAQAIGHLQYLWWWALDFAPTGDLSQFTPAEISAGAEWPGQPGPFHEALTECGWIDGDGTLHNWGDYAGRLIERKEADRKRKRESRLSVGHPQDIQRKSALTTPTAPTQPTTPEKPGGGGVGGSAEAEAKAATFARNWISANLPSHLRSGPAAFARLILRLGKDEAVRLVQGAMMRPDVGNPFTWLEAKLDKQSAGKAAEEAARPPRLTKVREYNV